ncbi:MAG TPA: nuclear transport factor 2 family protein [Sphingomicrobium sp.]|nr:nuclear transport factor 2 family protein [Sphingomicrobium sp.]
MDDPREEIRRVINDRIDAIRSKDAASAVACLAPEILAFEMVPPLVSPAGAARDADAFGAWLAGFEEIDVEPVELAIEADERIGFAAALHHLVGTRIGGHAVSLWMRSTLCFLRDCEGWKIVHSHTSVPFYPGREPNAALDLQPQSTD